MLIINNMKNEIKKKKAFTLVELMGLLVIIGVLSAILIPAISNDLKENKKKAYQTQLQNIMLAAKNFVSDNIFLMPEIEGDSISITLGQLKKSGYAEHSIINPKTKQEISNCLQIDVKKINNDYEYIIQENTIQVDNCNGDYTSDILIYGPSKTRVVSGELSSYILTINPSNNGQVSSYTFDGSKLSLGEETDAKYSVVGEAGIYKIIIKAGEKEGEISLTFEENAITDNDGNNVDMSSVAYDKIIVNNTIYRNSIEVIKIGDTIIDSSIYTRDPSTLGKKNYLKHEIGGYKVTKSYACAMFEDEEVCIMGGNPDFFGYAADEKNYTGNLKILYDLTSKYAKEFKLLNNSEGIYYCFVYDDGNLCANEKGEVSSKLGVGICSIGENGGASCSEEAYSWSTDIIKIGDSADSFSYTTDPSTLGKNYYLKHEISGYKVTKSYACAIFEGEEVCLTGGNPDFYGYADDEKNYTGNLKILYDLKEAGKCNVNSGFTDHDSWCNSKTIEMDAGLSGFVSSNDKSDNTNKDFFCKVYSNGEAICEKDN